MYTDTTTRLEARGACARRATALLLALILVCLAAPSFAFGIPEGGASADTPGTYAEVSPKELRPGATIQFAVSGYPAGEVLNIKIDDGLGYSDQGTAGTGVVHTQLIGASGSTSGSLRLPSDLTEGWHWLRFLASETIAGKGVLGYTNGAGSASNTGHPTAFYVAGESMGGATAEESVVASTSPGVVDASQGGAGSTNNSNAALVEGEEEAMTAEEAAAAADAAVMNSTTRAGTTGATTGAASTGNRATTTGAFDELPLPGLIVLGAVVVLGIAALMFVALKRPRPAIVSPVDDPDQVGDGRSFGGGFTGPGPADADAAVATVVADPAAVAEAASAAAVADTAAAPVEAAVPDDAAAPVAVAADAAETAVLPLTSDTKAPEAPAQADAEVVDGDAAEAVADTDTPVAPPAADAAKAVDEAAASDAHLEADADQVTGTAEAAALAEATASLDSAELRKVREFVKQLKEEDNVVAAPDEEAAPAEADSTEPASA
ncbi:MAG: hypothetical protein LBL23_02740 [Coriobacteriales bacterium]|jgi:hypothetical protein|nr:hypothetical protein [Coriobacteriales bacterium]